MPLSKRVAWITGAGRGIGRACALAFAKDGMNVGLTSRTGKELKAVAKECEALGARATIAACDVTDRSALEAAHRGITSQLGAPLVLVNAAGLARSESFLKTTPAFMQSLWDLNVMGAFHASQIALPPMLKEGWGRVVNIASVAGQRGAPYIAAYAASKHALVGLTRVLAVEFAAKGITANAVCPGYVDTQMTSDNVKRMVEKTGRSSDDILRFIRQSNPQGRLITADEVAAAALMLCREDSAGINGQTLTIDGGGVQG